MTDAAALAKGEVIGILDGYFRQTLRVDLDEDIPACAEDIIALFAFEDPGHDALWRKVDRQWGQRWQSDRNAYERHLGRIKKLHPPYGSPPDICQECRQPWPCRTWQTIEHDTEETE
jgi:hypothetical protein